MHSTSRKYRPKTFEEVFGQEAFVATLKNALRMQRVSQAYLFCGSRGTGKTTLARLLAKALNCSNLTDSQEPCNNCASCLEIASGKSLSVFEIDGASNRGVDDIRQINETVCYAPPTGKYKIYIIDEVHMLTKEAFNALLKTLEEPPPHVKFFFATTEPHKVLPTIISRCQRFDLHRISVEKIALKLERIIADSGVSFDKEAVRLIAQMAEGSLRDAESLLDRLLCSDAAKNHISEEAASLLLGTLSRQHLFALDEAMHTSNLSYAFKLSQELFSQGKEFHCFLEALIEHYRSLLLTKLYPTQSHPLPKEYAHAASLYTQDQCLYLLDFLISSFQQSAKSSFKQALFETILLHIIRSKYRLSAETLVKHLLDARPTQPQDAPIQPPTEPIGPPAIPPQLPPPPPPPPPPSSQQQEVQQTPDCGVKEVHKSKYDTLLRFAAVELEGSVKKD